MQKIRLVIIGLTTGQSQGSYALILSEESGHRKLPVIIGSFEAQSIAMVIENVPVTRPMTHDLFKSFTQTFGINMNSVIIHNLIDGVFFAKLICEDADGNTVEIDSRTSDAIALAVRYKCPIYTYEHILQAAGIASEEGGDELEEEAGMAELAPPPSSSTPKEEGYSTYSTEQLRKMLDEAIGVEDYDRAARIRDELNRREK